MYQYEYDIPEELETIKQKINKILDQAIKDSEDLEED